MKTDSCVIRPLRREDAQAFHEAFQAQGWDKPTEQFLNYFAETESGTRRVFTAEWEGRLAGYVTLLFDCPAGPFANSGLPEIVDFNVLIPFQRHGIGGMLMDAVEAAAFERSNTVVIGVGLHSGYGPAQRMYVKRGYVPDGSGVWYLDSPLAPNADCVNDDDLVLYLTKQLHP